MKSIKISDAKEMAKKYDAQAIVIFSVARDGTLKYVTYGENKEKCNIIGWWAKKTIDRCLSIMPFRTHFGWGENGTPKPFSGEEWKLVPANAREIIMKEAWNEKGD